MKINLKDFFDVSKIEFTEEELLAPYQEFFFEYSGNEYSDVYDRHMVDYKNVLSDNTTFYVKENTNIGVAA